jgi:ornithine cyclodeaminase/alanine dehydrogenase-like protein (mu-crystallin family)
MAIFFSEDDVSRLLPMGDAVARVEDAFRLLGEGKAVNRPRQRVRLQKLMLHVLSAGSDAIGYCGLKAYTTGPSGARFYFLLFGAASGELVAMMEADRLGQIRTGAATAVATRYLARPSATTVGIYGTGWQARSQLEALAVSRGLSAILAYGRDETRRRSFCAEMSKTLGRDVVAASSPEEVASGAGILVVATSAREPVLLGRWLRPGHHVNAVGSNALSRREIDEAAVLRARFIAADSVEQAKLECGDLHAVVEAGKLSWEQVHELGDVVSGRISLGRAPDDVTLFESQGLAIEDVAVAKLVYERGREEGLGRRLDV